MNRGKDRLGDSQPPPSTEPQAPGMVYLRGEITAATTDKTAQRLADARADIAIATAVTAAV
ncbi:hypothetical protein [Streptomyces fructofermentans]|uniref:hypothetical protein n=1 Tax=Streptomyces fructofermentans TaxID=152141 RepID=UPI0033D6A8E8